MYAVFFFCWPNMLFYIFFDMLHLSVQRWTLTRWCAVIFQWASFISSGALLPKGIEKGNSYVAEWDQCMLPWLQWRYSTLQIIVGCLNVSACSPVTQTGWHRPWAGHTEPQEMGVTSFEDDAPHKNLAWGRKCSQFSVHSVKACYICWDWSLAGWKTLWGLPHASF